MGFPDSPKMLGIARLYAVSGIFRLDTAEKICFIRKDKGSGGNAARQCAMCGWVVQGWIGHLQGRPAVNRAASPVAAFFR